MLSDLFSYRESGNTYDCHALNWALGLFSPSPLRNNLLVLFLPLWSDIYGVYIYYFMSGKGLIKVTVDLQGSILYKIIIFYTKFKTSNLSEFSKENMYILKT